MAADTLFRPATGNPPDVREIDAGSLLAGEFMDACTGRFQRPEVRDRAARYVRALYHSPPRQAATRVPRLHGEPRADGVQRLLNAARWDEDGVRDDLLHFVRGKLPQAPPVFVLAASAFTKRGTHSAGTATQLTPDGIRTRCQVALFLAIAVRRDILLVDRELHLPGPETLALAGSGHMTSDQIDGHDTYQSLARGMLSRALAETDVLPWVVSNDGLIDASDLAAWLDTRTCAYVLAMWPPAPNSRQGGRPSRHDDHFGQHASGAPAMPWHWSIAAADAGRGAGQPKWMLQGRPAGTAKTAARYLVSAPLGTSVREMIDMTEYGLRAKDAIVEARKSVGLANYEVRTLRAWRRYTMLALVAQCIRALDRLAAWRCEPAEPRDFDHA